MNPIAIMQMAMMYFKLNGGQSAQAKVVFKEGMDKTFKKAKEYHRKSFRFKEPQKTSKKFLKKK